MPVQPTSVDPQSPLPARGEGGVRGETPEREPLPQPPAAREEGLGPVGTGGHVVKEGECISSIAKDTGHFWQTLWDDPGNAELRNVRNDRNVLLPGDRVHVPALREKWEPGQTEMRHRFRRKGWPEVFRVRVLRDGEPLANAPYTVEVDGKTLRGTTDADGRLSRPIVPNAKRATVRVGNEPDISEYVFALGEINPITELTGVQARLINLGFDCGPIDGVLGERTEAALRDYQRSRRLPVTGEPDEETRRQLQADYGC